MGCYDGMAGALHFAPNAFIVLLLRGAPKVSKAAELCNSSSFCYPHPQCLLSLCQGDRGEACRYSLGKEGNFWKHDGRVLQRRW